LKTIGVVSRRDPLARHLTTREEELSEIDYISFERLSTLLCQGVECGFEDIALIEVRFIIVVIFTHHA
jgi:hypothetical protein